MRRIAGPFAVACVLLVAVGGCTSKKSTPSSAPPASTSASSTADTAAGGSTVTIKGFSFTPDTLNVKVGTTVVVTNTSSATHTFTSVSGPASFDTGQLAGGASGQVTFAKAGTYAYHCSIHNAMTGTVIVS